MKQIAYFIEFIPHWSPGDQKMPMSFLLSSSNKREVFIVNNSAFDILNLIISDTSTHKLTETTITTTSKNIYVHNMYI